MDLTELLPSLYGFRPDLQVDDRRIPNLLRKAARRVCRETQLVEQETVLVLNTANQLVALPGTSIVNYSGTGGTKTRVLAAVLTPPVAQGQTVYVDVTLSESCDLIAVETDTPSWIRVYGSAASRLADAGRSYAVDPTPGTGLMGEVATYAPDFLKINFSPVPFFDNLDPVTLPVAYLAVTPMQPLFNGPVSITFTYLPQEASYPGPDVTGLGILGVGAMGDQILSNGAILADEALGWEAGIRLNVLAWYRLYFKDSKGVNPPGIPTQLSMDDYQEWLLRKSSGNVIAPGQPEVFSDVLGALRVAPAWDVGAMWDSLVARITVEPVGNFTKIPGLTSAAEDAVLNMAYAEILGFPGRGLNLAQSQVYRNAGLNLCASLRGQRRIGNAPSNRERSNPFSFRVR